MEGIRRQQQGLKSPGSLGSPLSLEDAPPKKGLARAWEVVKMLYQNEVTRSIGRDLLFFAGAVTVIRFLVVALEEPLPAGATPPLPAPSK